MKQMKSILTSSMNSQIIIYGQMDPNFSTLFHLCIDIDLLCACLPKQIRSKHRPMCLDSSVDTHAMNKPIKMWPCHNQGGNQVSRYHLSVICLDVP